MALGAAPLAANVQVGGQRDREDVDSCADRREVVNEDRRAVGKAETSCLDKRKAKAGAHENQCSW